MLGSVEAAKDAEKSAATAEAAKPAAKPTAKSAVKPAPVAAKSAETAPRLLTRAARFGKAALGRVMADPRMAAVAAVALVVGTTFGMVAAPRERTGLALGRIDAALEGTRAETARLNGEVERLMVALAAIRDAGEAARGDARQLRTTLGDSLTRMEQDFDKRLAALGDRLAPVEQTAGTAPTAPIAHATAAPTAPVTHASTPATTPVAAAQATPRAEPTQTGALPDPRTDIRTDAKAEAKPKTDTAENWALREVYDGIAMLEDRKRRLIEVVPGDSIPGLGRVESIERRGRNWVVVTRQGVITPQMW